MIDVSTEVYPIWGDGADLIRVLDVVAVGDGRFVSETHHDGGRVVVEASQMLAQALVAAGRIAPGRRCVSAHLVAGRPADTRLPLEFEVETLSHGRTVTSLLVHVRQQDRRCATAQLLLDVGAPDLIRHASPAPPAAGPDDAVPFDMGVTGRELRVVDGAYDDDPRAAPGPPVIDAWVRFREVPDDPVLHAALLVQFTGHMSIAAAMRPHAGIGQRDAHETISTGINAIALSLHADVHADRWVRYHHESTFAGDGMTHSACRAYDESGTLLASFSVDAMVRPFVDGRTGDKRVDL
ncbi:MAG TPA: acyl-CoA thioesterase domain-containing protein [Candidatus Limnocylindrales bacterium]